MQFIVKRDILLKSLNFVQGVVEKKNTLPILSNVLLQLKNNKLSIIATDLDIIFYDEISDVKIVNEGSTTTSAAILYDILRKISSNTELNFNLKSENKLSLKSENADFNLLCLPNDNFPTFADEFEGQEISLNNSRFLKLLNKTKISISNDDTRHYLNGIYLHLTEAHGRNFLTGVATDSHRLSSSSLEIENINDFTSLILPRKTVFQLCSLLTEETSQLTMQTTDNKVKFNLGNISGTDKPLKYAAAGEHFLPFMEYEGPNKEDLERLTFMTEAGAGGVGILRALGKKFLRGSKDRISPELQDAVNEYMRD